MKYDLFISYVRRDEAINIQSKTLRAVGELKRQLEAHFHLERRGRRFRVCTDIEDIELGNTLPASQEKALAEIPWLLVICSPHASVSRWVRHEVETFLSMEGGQERIIAGLLGKKPAECFPTIFSDDRMGIDLIPPAGATVSEWRQRLANESHKVVAKVWSLPLPQVNQRFQRELARRRRLRATASILALLLVGVTILAAFLQGAQSRERQARRHQEYNRMILNAQKLYEDAQVSQARSQLEEISTSDLTSLRSFAWSYLWHLTNLSVGALPEARTTESLSFSPDRKILAAAAGSQVDLWKLETQELEAVLRPGKGRLFAVAFSPDGSRIAAGGQDKDVFVWNDAFPDEPTILESGKIDVRGLAWAQDGTRLISCGGAGDYGEVLIWDMETNKLLKLLEYEEPVRAVDVAPDGVHFALGIGRDASRSWIEVRDLQSLSVRVRHETQSHVGAVRFFPDGGSIAFGGGGRHIERLSLVEQRVIKYYWDHPRAVNAVDVSPDGSLVASVSIDGKVRLWDAETGHLNAILLDLLDDAHGGSATALAVRFSRDGETLAAGGISGAIRLWQISRMPVRQIFVHDSPVLSIAVVPGEKELASVTGDGIYRMWDLASAKPRLVQSLSPNGLNSVAFSPTGEWAAIGGMDGLIRIVRSEDGSVVHELVSNWPWVEAVAFSAEDVGLLAAAGGEQGSMGGVAVWRVEDWQLMRAWKTGPDLLEALDFHPTEARLAVAGVGEEVTVWNPLNASQERQLFGHLPVEFDLTGQRLAFGVLPTIKLLDLNRGSADEAVVLDGHSAWAQAIAFHPGGRAVASGGFDGTIHIWDGISGSQRLVWPAHDDQVFDLEFSDTGARLFSASADGTVIVWASND